MAEYVKPEAAFSSRGNLGAGQSGLVGVVRFRLLDNDGAADDPVYGPSIIGVIEDPAGSGSYVFNGVAPAAAGKYSRAWDAGVGTELVFDDDLIVSASAPAAVVPAGHDLCALADVLSYVPGYTADEETDAKLQQLITAESELFMRDVGLELVPTGAQPADRVFAVEGWVHEIDVGALATTAGLELTLLDRDGDETGTIDPLAVIALYDGAHQPVDGWAPISSLQLRVGRYFRPGDAVRITGSWGFPSIPAFVREAVAATVLLHYLSDVANSGTELSDALDNVSIRGLVIRREDAVDALNSGAVLID